MLLRICFAACLAVVCVSALACNHGKQNEELSAAGSVSASLKGTSLTDPGSGLRLSWTASELRSTVEHFDVTLPANKIRHRIELRALTTPLVSIEVWDNPRHQTLDEWFEGNLAFMGASGATLERGRAGKDGWDAILVTQPRSPQSEERKAAVFAAGDRMIRVTCYDAQDERSARTFEELLAGIEVAR